MYVIESCMYMMHIPDLGGVIVGCDELYMKPSITTLRSHDFSNSQ
jgi:hypothetical protein